MHMACECCVHSSVLIMKAYTRIDYLEGNRRYPGRDHGHYYTCIKTMSVTTLILAHDKGCDHAHV